MGGEVKRCLGLRAELLCASLLHSQARRAVRIASDWWRESDCGITISDQVENTIGSYPDVRFALQAIGGLIGGEDMIDRRHKSSVLQIAYVVDLFQDIPFSVSAPAQHSQPSLTGAVAELLLMRGQDPVRNFLLILQIERALLRMNSILNQ